MKQSFVSNHLVYDESKRLWMLPSSFEFGFTDGSSQEEYMRNSVRECNDLSPSSEQLESYIKDWPSEYHFSSLRHRLFEIFKINPDARILEIGCGCGAITRYLGEMCKNVLSVEGSMIRAEITRLRTHDLDSVTVVAAPFQDLKFKEVFDLVIFNGVIEYFPSFIDEEDVYPVMMDRIKHMISPNGSVIIAIENQFGLKYLGGDSEDHAGIPYEGVNGYPQWSDRIRTFGRYELERLLRHVGFSDVDVYLPFPDYKLPKMILSEKILHDFPEFDFGEFISNFQYESKFFKPKMNYNPFLVWSDISKNQLVPHLSNSFLFLAHASTPDHIVPKQEITFWSSNRRKRKYQTMTVGVRSDTSLLLKKVPLNAHSNSLIQSHQMTWCNGDSMALTWYRASLNPSFSSDQFLVYMLEWVRWIEPNFSGADVGLGGEYVDLCPWNIIQTPSGLNAIDKEWVWKESVSLKILFCRSLFYFMMRYSVDINLFCKGTFSCLRDVMCDIGAQVFTHFDHRDLNNFIEFETALQFEVTLSSSKKSIRKHLQKKLCSPHHKRKKQSSFLSALWRLFPK